LEHVELEMLKMNKNQTSIKEELFKDGKHNIHEDDLSVKSE